MAVEAEVAAADLSLADTDINWDRFALFFHLPSASSLFLSFFFPKFPILTLLYFDFGVHM